ncbi:peptidase [Taibaiella lutea]|uniref:Peptidase n=1 Tax=Taibaiella lutea TaxID=2608001 RepID=A0A5M6CLP2_9BACT|nr:murein L,D-transpeptidase catalytic domain family protein [Taibaiella lutea]KAA5534902.1 peptidase [Taibaiella lutea]
MKLISLLFIFCFLGCVNNSVEGFEKPFPVAAKMAMLKKKAIAAKAYCKANDMDLSTVILINMNIHSGLKRFVVWDFKKDTIMMEGLVTHGCGTSKWGSDESKTKPVFSNTPDSHCSSLGKYKIGERGYSSWGIHVKYLLHGLESTNNNALARTVVLHGWNAIPDYETYPDGISESWGCPAVSNDFMAALDSLLKKKANPVLLWIYK